MDKGVAEKSRFLPIPVTKFFCIWSQASNSHKSLRKGGAADCGVMSKLAGNWRSQLFVRGVDFRGVAFILARLAESFFRDVMTL